jgi:hypothetical protein
MLGHTWLVDVNHLNTATLDITKCYLHASSLCRCVVGLNVTVQLHRIPIAQHRQFLRKDNTVLIMSVIIGSGCLQSHVRRPSRPAQVLEQRAKCARSQAAANGAAAAPLTGGDYVQLGSSPLTVSSVGVGTLAWGDPGQVGKLDSVTCFKLNRTR